MPRHRRRDHAAPVFSFVLFDSVQSSVDAFLRDPVFLAVGLTVDLLALDARAALGAWNTRTAPDQADSRLCHAN